MIGFECYATGAMFDRFDADYALVMIVLDTGIELLVMPDGTITKYNNWSRDKAVMVATGRWIPL